jgi:hypothetical protein
MLSMMQEVIPLLMMVFDQLTLLSKHTKKYLMHLLVVHVQEKYNNMFGVGTSVKNSLHTHKSY